ncbi:MAG: hypothetical protein NE328_15115 [Lentisphaeraceae bacterium]|nr:hypothetical protein [Lentisphaeraceae bacterium]
MKLISLIITALLTQGVLAITSQSPSAFAVVNSPAERGLIIELEELPIKVQNAVNRTCKGEILSITQMFVYSNIFYKIVCESENGQNVYLFDTEGLPPN